MSATPAAASAREVLLAALKEKLPEEEFATFEADPEFKNVPEGFNALSSPLLLADPEAKYPCATQRKLSPFSSKGAIVVGLGPQIPRWHKGDIIKYATKKTGYPSRTHAQVAAYKLAEAVAEWNSYNVGVKFEWVTKIDDACFVLEYGGAMGGVLAEAFFPDEEPIHAMYVYQRSFMPDNQRIQKNIFLHELGHVIGLRHEFALERERDTPAVRFGAENKDSVMGYTLPPTIQQSDIVDTKAFYELPENGDIEGVPIAAYTPDN